MSDEQRKLFERQSRVRQRAARWSLGVGVLVLLIKLYAFVMTRSAAVLSDALESGVDLLTSAFVLYCAHISSLPPDENHPYGHGKAEHFSVGFQGGMILVAGLAVWWETVDRWWNAAEIYATDQGMLLLVMASLVNLILGLGLLRAGRSVGSGLLVADGKHALMDVVTTLGALIGLWLVAWTGETIWDRVVAFLIGAHLLWSGGKLLKEAVSGLMDEADQPTLQLVVEAVNHVREEGWLDMHNLRASNHGGMHHIDFHLVVPAEWTIAQAHRSMDLLEKEILSKLGRPGSVIIHLDYKLDAEVVRELARDNSHLSQRFSLSSASRIVHEH